MIHKPDFYYKDIFSINYNSLKNNNIKILLFDIDNTIKKKKKKEPDNKDIKLFNTLKNDFNIILFSNALPYRVKRYANVLGIKDYYSLASKPLSYKYKKIINKYNTSSNNIAAIGDQLYTDIKGANKIGITSILVDKISNNESIIPKINRYRENRIIKKYNLLERGKYND